VVVVKLRSSSSRKYKFKLNRWPKGSMTVEVFAHKYTSAIWVIEHTWRFMLLSMPDSIYTAPLP
jgi:hypothetical protein